MGKCSLRVDTVEKSKIARRLLQVERRTAINRVAVWPADFAPDAGSRPQQGLGPAEPVAQPPRELKPALGMGKVEKRGPQHVVAAALIEE